MLLDPTNYDQQIDYFSSSVLEAAGATLGQKNRIVPLIIIIVIRQMYYVRFIRDTGFILKIWCIRQINEFSNRVRQKIKKSVGHLNWKFVWLPKIQVNEKGKPHEAKGKFRWLRERKSVCSPAASAKLLFKSFVC